MVESSIGKINVASATRRDKKRHKWKEPIPVNSGSGVLMKNTTARWTEKWLRSISRRELIELRKWGYKMLSYPPEYMTRMERRRALRAVNEWRRRNNGYPYGETYRNDGKPVKRMSERAP